MSINACVNTKYGSGTHQYQVSSSNLPALFIGIWISELIFTLSTSFMKLSVLVFYLRLAVTKTWWLIIWGSIAFIFSWLIGFTFFIIFVSIWILCDRKTAWLMKAAMQFPKPILEPSYYALRCANNTSLHPGLTNTLTDIYIYVLRMGLLWDIQLPK
jgi:hypothetical protein